MLFKASLFLKEVWDKRINFKYWDDIIGNIDDTPLFYNMAPSKTIAKKRGKSILIRIQNQEKCLIFVILTITASGKKLPPI